MANIEASIEGPVESVTANGPGVVIRTMDVAVHFTPGQTATGLPKTIESPATELTVAQLLDPTSFPGRPESGFEGGTIIAEGSFDTDSNVFHADAIAIEPAESVLLGAVTENSAGPPRVLRINGTEVEMLTDPRMPANPDNPAQPIYFNEFGFQIKVESIQESPTGPTPDPPPAPSAAEGYFADGKFYAFLFEYGGPGELVVDPTTTPQVSMERASYRDRGTQFEVEARGFATSSHAPAGTLQNIEVFRVDVDPATGDEVETPLDQADVEDVAPGFQRWRARIRENKGGGLLAGVPELIRVKNHSGITPDGLPAREQDTPDIRED